MTVSSITFVLNRSSMAASRLWLLVLCMVIVSVLGAPFDIGKDHRKAMEEIKEQLKKLNDIPGLDKDEYLRYWKEAVKDDPRFERLRELGDLKHDRNMERMVEDNPIISNRMAHDSDNVRSRLEEAKRGSIEQVRQLQRLQMLRDDKALKDGDWANRLEAIREKMPPNFSREDIAKRIQEQNELLEKIDTERHSEFKRVEMQAEHRRREMLKKMDEKKRLEAEEEFQNQQKKIRSHEKLHHPASEQQLEDVWEKEDGLDKDNFDPRTFFHLHDKNSDRQLDAMEWESMFYNEMRKVYGDKMGGIESQEDMARMREHVIKEMDKDGDGLTSLDEFLTYSKGEGFKDDEAWKSVVEEDNFDEEEMDKYEEDYDDYYDYEYDEHGNLIGYKTKQKEGQHEEEAPDKMPSQVNDQGQPPHHGDEQGQPPRPGDEQGQPPHHGDEGVQPPHHSNDQGQPPAVVNEQGLPPRLPGNDVPQIDDPQAVHFNPVNDREGVAPQGNQNL